MVRITWILITLLFVVVRTTTSSADDETYVTEMEYSTILLMDTTFTTKKVEMSSTRSNGELRTHVTTTSTRVKPTNATATTEHSVTSPTKKEQSSTSTTLTKQLSTSKVSTSKETSAHVTVTSPTHNTPPSIVSTSSTTTPFQLESTTTSLPKSSSKPLLPTIVTTTVGSSKSRNTSAEVKSTPSSSYADRSTTKRGFFSSPVIRSSSETYSSTVTSSMHDGTRLTTHAKSTKDADLTTDSAEPNTTHAKSTLDAKLITDSSEPDTNGFPLIAAGAGGAIVLMVGAGCLLVGARKARKRQFWGSGANGSGVAEIGMIFTKTPNRENGLNSEDAIEVDTGLSCVSENETESNAKIKIQGVGDSTEVDLPLSTFTPGPENFKRAQDRNLSDMIIVKDEEDDYFGDGDYRDSIAL